MYYYSVFAAIDCQNGRVYKMCGPISDETCSSPVTAEPVRPSDLCIEGCYCPEDSALHKDQCIPRSECPCTLRQKNFQPGEQVPNDCNTWLVFFLTSLPRLVLQITKITDHFNPLMSDSHFPFKKKMKNNKRNFWNSF